MKKLSTLILGAMLSFGSFSQFVTINDPGFVNWLTFNYPTCMSGNQMDTTCNDIVTEGWVSITGYTINDLDGLQYFDAMSTFQCMNNSVSSIPFLPQSNLLTYNVANNNLTTIPNIPSTVTKLDIRLNNLTSIPALPSNLDRYFGGSNPNLPLPAFPNTITELDISDNNLTTFPTLWPGIINLSIGGNPAATIPTLPPNLLYLSIIDQGITQLPAIPATVIGLQAQQNDFTVLNNFPPNLETLSLGSTSTLDSVYNLPNSITTMSIQQTSMVYIGNIPSSIENAYLDGNNLTTIPTLPAGIDKLNVDNNQLTGFDFLPATMGMFRAMNNNISCLPIVPDVPGTIYFNMTGNPITCLPNYTNDLNATFLSLPLCDVNDPVNNPQGCPTAEGISGYLFEDGNSDCARQNFEQGIQNIPVRLYDSGMNQVGMVSSLSNGRYFFPAPIGAYDVVVDTLGRPIQPTCAVPGIDSSVVLTAIDTLADQVNFGFECKPGFDIGATAAHVDGWVFPGQVHSLSLNIGDLSHFYNLNCAAGTGGTVTITLTGPVNYISNSSGTLNPNVSGLTFTYPIADFAAVDFFNDFGLEFETETTAQSGDQVCVNVSVTPTTGDINLSNNTFNYCYEVVNSYDPNNKLVFPKDVAPGFDGYLTYTINFQNTGSAPAFNIRLVDTLSTDLDLSTFEIIDYSHTNHYLLEGNILQVFYPDIMLVDSTTNEPESKGYVTFKVKPTNSMNIGDSIDNKVYIYFDFNAPILTNTATVSVVTFAQVDEFSIDANVYPIPFKDHFVVDGVEPGAQLVLSNPLGDIIWSQIAQDNPIYEAGDMSSGIYFLTIVSGEKKTTLKLLKE